MNTGWLVWPREWGGADRLLRPRDANVLLAGAGDLALDLHVRLGLVWVANFAVNGGEIALDVFPAVDYRDDVIRTPLLTSRDFAFAHMADAAVPVEQPQQDAGRWHCVWRLADPSLDDAGHLVTTHARPLK